ncbi:MAG: terpene cyclase/mutase family protein [Phycisphaerales bacterium]|nr:MAG: terpene cyclase/mutase family protein [Phycisphaerales bacterium]
MRGKPDIDVAVDYVRSHGDPIEQARLAAVLYGRSPEQKALGELSGLQNADGGFGYWLADRSVSTVCDTTYVLGWLDDLSIRGGPMVETAVRFLFRYQEADGGWDEVPEITRLDPPEFLTPGETKTRVWLTAYCAHRLMRFGYAESPLCRGCPITYLLAHREEPGRLVGYQRATWDALPLFARFPLEGMKPFEQALRVTQAEFAPREWAGSYLAWLLRCLRDADLPGSHPLVREALDELVGRQGPDGSWDSEDGESYAASATVEALRVLKDYGIV